MVNWMSEKRFSTNGYYIRDNFHNGINWLVNEVDAQEIVTVMNGLDIKVRESRKGLSKLQKKNERLQQQQQRLFNYFKDYLKDEIDGNNFSEMWDNVKEDERWG